MSQLPGAPDEARPATQLLALGTGWVGSAILLAVLLSLTYLPTHAGNASGADGFIATIAGLYVVGFSLALVRVTRGALLRLGGSTEPIALLGSDAGVYIDPRIGAGWRLAAVAAGTIVAITAAVGAALVGASTPPGTYAHALAILGIVANLALVGGALIPTPGFTGWALVLAVADLRGSTPDTRVRRASRLARVLGIPMFLGLALLAWLLGDAALMVASVIAAVLIRTRSRWAEGHDAIARFLARHVVGDFARPIINRADGTETLAELAQRVDATGVTAIEAGGALVGAVGPRQLARRSPGSHGEPVSARMVALADIPQLSASSPAAGIVGAVARHGFAFVRGPGGLGWVEAGDVLAQILMGLGGTAGTTGADPESAASVRPSD